MKKKLILGMTVLFMIIAVMFIACPGDSSSGGGDDAAEEENRDNPVILPGSGTQNPDGKGGVLLMEGEDVVLTVNVTEEDVTYQWYMQYKAPGDETAAVHDLNDTYKIANATRQSYKLVPNKNGTYFLYVKITYDDGSIKVSAILRVRVTDIPPNSTVAAKPVLTAPASAAYFAGTPAGEVADLVVRVTVTEKETSTETGITREKVGAVEYVWGMTTGGDDDAVEVPGTTGTRDGTGNYEATLTYKPDASTAGTTYYYLKVTNTIPAGENVPEAFRSRFERSLPAARIDVVEKAKPPKINTQPAEKLYTTEASFNTTKVALRVAAVSQDGGDLSWQWHRVDLNGADTVVGENKDNYMPDPPAWNVSDTSPKRSIYYYYCVVTNTLPDITGLKRVTPVQTDTVYIGIGVSGLTLSSDVKANDKPYDGTKNATLNTDALTLVGKGSADVRLVYDHAEFVQADVKAVNPQSSEEAIDVVLMDWRLVGNDKDSFVLAKPDLKAKINRASGAAVASIPVETGTTTSFKIAVDEISLATNATELQQAQQTVEYGIGTASGSATLWQDSPVFTEYTTVGTAEQKKLKSDTTYFIFARSKASASGNYKAGNFRVSSGIKTAKGSDIAANPVPTPTNWGFDVAPVTVTNSSATGQIAEYAASANGGLKDNRTELDKLVWTQEGSTSITGLENKANYYVYARAQKNNDYDSGDAKVSGVSMTLDPCVSFVCDRNEYPHNIPGVVVPINTKLVLTDDQKELASSNPTGSSTSATGSLSSAFYALDWYYEDEAKLLKPWDFDKAVNKSFTLYVKWVEKDLKDEMRDNKNLIWVNGGSFTMGSPTSESGRDTNETQHKVTLSGFWIGRYSVTQVQWKSVMGKNPSTNKATIEGEDPDLLPVETISWYEVLVFCNKLSMAENLTPAYSINGKTDPVQWGDVPTTNNATWNAVTIVQGSTGYRLPTEAQWEYACRAGTTTAYSTGDLITPSTAWYSVNAENNTHQVGLRPIPNGNPWGLFDMHGNVWDWCWDWYDPKYGNNNASGEINPTGATSGTYRMLRGGGWDNLIVSLRSAARYATLPYSYGYVFGLRIVRP